MAAEMGRLRTKGAARIAVGVLATATLGGAAVAASTLPFTTPASASTLVTAKTAKIDKTLTIKTEHVANLGTVLATASGRTLYRWANDPAGKVMCTGACAKVWPPLLAPKGVSHIKAPHGVKGLSLVSVAGGRKQVFFHGQALYGFVKDTKKGEATGQDVNAFFAVLSNGKSSAPASVPATTTPTTAASPAAAATPAPTTSTTAPVIMGSTSSPTTAAPAAPVTTSPPVTKTTTAPTSPPPAPTTTTTQPTSTGSGGTSF
jgi:predicted lipoprotein with Yx(FWY)xxD motif